MGWSLFFCSCFNTQPPEGGWCTKNIPIAWRISVSTHSRPKAAGFEQAVTKPIQTVSTHSRPKAAGFQRQKFHTPQNLFQHTAARRRLGIQRLYCFRVFFVSTHSRPKAAGLMEMSNGYALYVSTHSRPKAAGQYAPKRHRRVQGFNTQPPEGGWDMQLVAAPDAACFNTQPPEGGWVVV